MNLFSILRQPIPPEIRLAVYQRDGGRCRYCGDPVALDRFHCDHEVSVADGGTDDADNLLTACPPCNLSKGRKPLSVWRGRPGAAFIFTPARELRP